MYKIKGQKAIQGRQFTQYIRTLKVKGQYKGL